jgi:hypothetical protein
VQGNRGLTTLKRVFLSLAVGTLMTGCDGGGRGGNVSLPSGGYYGQSIYYRCEDGLSFRAIIDTAARHAVVELGEDRYTLKRAGASRAGEVYSDGTMRLTVAADGRAHLIVRPGTEMTACEPLIASGN